MALNPPRIRCRVNYPSSTNHEFVNADFAGSSALYSAGIITPVVGASYASGGSVDPNSTNKLNPNTFGANPGGYRTDQGSISPKGSFSVGAMYSYGITW